MVFESVSRSVPWASPSDVQTALRLCDFEFDAAVEMLIANPPVSRDGGEQGRYGLTEAYGAEVSAVHTDTDGYKDRDKGKDKTRTKDQLKCAKGLSKKVAFDTPPPIPTD